MRTSAIVALAALALAGCGGSSSSSTTTQSATSAPTDAATILDTSASPAATLSPAASPTAAVAYSDLNGVVGGDKIVQLAQLGAFDATQGAFDPNATISRRVFARWLFRANNGVWRADDGKQFRPAPASEAPAFKDMPASDPDFSYVQGLQDAGVSVGFPDKTFRPDAPLTREQMLAIKSLVDYGGVDKEFVISKSSQYGYYVLPSWKDKKDISPEYVAPISTAVFHDSSKIDNIGRVFGAIAVLRPKAPVTRGQAALVLWKFGDHTSDAFSARSAADALASATATP